MIYLVPIGGERPPAVGADVGLFSRVSSDVVAKTSPLGKFALAVWEGAGIWLDPKMYVLVPRKRALRIEGLETVDERASQGRQAFLLRPD